MVLFFVEPFKLLHLEPVCNANFKVVFLEYERDRPKLLETYTKTHKFREFPMPSVEDKGGKLGQLFRFLD